jgi:hypothetical protein
MMIAPSAAPKNIAKSDATRLANLELLPFANEESAPMPVIVNVGTVLVRSELPNSGIPRAHGKRRRIMARAGADSQIRFAAQTFVLEVVFLFIAAFCSIGYRSDLLDHSFQPFALIEQERR